MKKECCDGKEGTNLKNIVKQIGFSSRGLVRQKEIVGGNPEVYTTGFVGLFLFVCFNQERNDISS